MDGGTIINLLTLFAPRALRKVYVERFVQNVATKRSLFYFAQIAESLRAPNTRAFTPIIW